MIFCNCLGLIERKVDFSARLTFFTITKYLREAFVKKPRSFSPKQAVLISVDLRGLFRFLNLFSLFSHSVRKSLENVSIEN